MTVLCPNGHETATGSNFCSVCAAPVDPIVEGSLPISEHNPEAVQSLASRWKRIPAWARIAIPLSILIVLIPVIAVSVAVIGSRPHIASEEDYRNAFSDIATALAEAGNPNWASPTDYPEPLATDDEALFEDLKSDVLDPTCEDLAEGEDALKRNLDLAVALAKDNNQSLPYVFDSNRAVFEAAARYICPQHAATAAYAQGYINVLSVLHS